MAILQTLRELGTATGRVPRRRRESPRDRGTAQRDSSHGPRLRAARDPARLRPTTAIVAADVRERRCRLSQRHPRSAGGTNVFADVEQESVQPSQETLLCASARRHHRGSFGTIQRLPQRMAAGERSAWSPLASIPAVRNSRIHLLTAAQFVVPGPRVGLAAEQLARILHPKAFK